MLKPIVKHLEMSQAESKAFYLLLLNVSSANFSQLLYKHSKVDVVRDALLRYAVRQCSSSHEARIINERMNNVVGCLIVCSGSCRTLRVTKTRWTSRR